MSLKAKIEWLFRKLANLANAVTFTDKNRKGEFNKIVLYNYLNNNTTRYTTTVYVHSSVSIQGVMTVITK